MNYSLLSNRLEVIFWLFLLTLPLTVFSIGYKTNRQVRTIFLQIGILLIYYFFGIVVAELRSKFNGSIDGISNVYQDDRFFIKEAYQFIVTNTWYYSDPHYTYASIIAVFGRFLSIVMDVKRMTLASVAIFVNAYFFSLGATVLHKNIRKKLPLLCTSKIQYLPFFVPMALTLGIVPLRDTLVCGFALHSFALILERKYKTSVVPFIMVFLLRPISGIVLGMAIVVHEYLTSKRLKLRAVLMVSGGIVVILVLSNILKYDIAGDSVTGHWMETKFQKNILNTNRSDEIEQSGSTGGISMMMKAPPLFRVVLVPLAFFIAPYPPKLRFDVPVMQGNEYAFEQIPFKYFEPVMNIILITSYILLLSSWGNLPQLIKSFMIASFLSVALTGNITFDARHKILLWPLAYYTIVYSFKSGMWSGPLKRLAQLLIIGQVILTGVFNFFKIVL